METTQHSILNQFQLFSQQARVKQLLPYFAIFIACLFWAGSFSTMKITVQALGPMSVMWIRLMIALMLLAPFSRVLVPRNFSKSDLKYLLPLVGLQPCMYFLLESNAMKYTTSSQAGVISSFVPLFVCIGAWFFFQERLTRKMLFGLVISMVGVVWLTLSGVADEQASNPLLGNVLEMMAMACAAGAILLVKQLSDRYNPWTLTALQTITGALFFLPGAPHALTHVWSISFTAQVSLLFLGACVTLLAFGLYNWAISRIDAGAASVFINMIPVLAISMGWVFLSETLTMLQCVACALVLFGVLYFQHHSGKKE